MSEEYLCSYIKRSILITDVSVLPWCLGPSFPGLVLCFGHLNFMTKAVIRADMWWRCTVDSGNRFWRDFLLPAVQNFSSNLGYCLTCKALARRPEIHIFLKQNLHLISMLFINCINCIKDNQKIKKYICTFKIRIFKYLLLSP